VPALLLTVIVEATQVMLLQPFQRQRRKGDELAVLLLQSYRALTHVLVHASLPHLIFNMYSFSGVGERLERVVGSVGLLQLVVVLALAKSFVLVSCEALLLFCFRQSRLLPGPLVGFSGVIFALFTVDSLLAHPGAQVSLFGMPVPARAFPVVLLVMQWVLFPFASVWGHAAGIAAGSMFSAGLLKWARFPAVVVKDLEGVLSGREGFIRGRLGRDALVSNVFSELWRLLRR
jgi:membrane associated rhomboid family serine protease